MERYITIVPEGLKLGNTLLAGRCADGALDLKQDRVLVLLQAAYGRGFPAETIRKIRGAERALKMHSPALMHIHFALAGFCQLNTREQADNLAKADAMLKSGMHPQAMLKHLNAHKFNPYHVPAGSPEGGQFTTAAGAGDPRSTHTLPVTNRDFPRSPQNPEGYVDNDSVTSDLIGGIIIPAAVIAVGIEAAGAAAAVGARVATRGRSTEWSFGKYKSSQRWQNQMKDRRWTDKQVTDIIRTGKEAPAPNHINKGNTATRYTDPNTGRFIVRDDITKEIIQISADKFLPPKVQTK